MKNIVLTVVIILSCIGCKKDKTNCGDTAFAPDYLEFGYSGGFAGIRKSFVIYKGQLFPVDTLHTALPVGKYAASLPVIDSFPAYLRVHPNQQFSCLGCADELVITIKARQGGVVTTWDIDTDINSLPVEIREYTRMTYSIIDEL